MINKKYEKNHIKEIKQNKNTHHKITKTQKQLIY